MKHIRRGQFGAYPMFADVGKEPQLQADFNVTSKALPVPLVPPVTDLEPRDHVPTKFDIVLLHVDDIHDKTTWRDIPAHTEMTAV
jgi:hypothetical protein